VPKLVKVIPFKLVNETKTEIHTISLQTLLNKKTS